MTNGPETMAFDFGAFSASEMYNSTFNSEF